MAYPFWEFPFWTCSRCGRKYSALENYCFFCREREEKEKLPPRHQYISIGTVGELKRGYYQKDLPID